MLMAVVFNVLLATLTWNEASITQSFLDVQWLKLLSESGLQSKHRDTPSGQLWPIQSFEWFESNRDKVFHVSL